MAGFTKEAAAKWPAFVTSRFFKLVIGGILSIILLVFLGLIALDLTAPAQNSPALVIPIEWGERQNQPGTDNIASADSTLPNPDDTQPSAQVDFNNPDQPVSGNTDILAPGSAQDAPMAPIAIIMTGLGANQEVASQALTSLPLGTTLAFSPYMNDTALIEQARARGYTVIADIPMQPSAYPDIDPGPLTLIDSRDWSENLINLEKIMQNAGNVPAATNNYGNLYLSDADQAESFARWLAEKDILFVENYLDDRNTELGNYLTEFDLKYMSSSMQIDAFANSQSIVGRLRQLERDARSNGYAIGYAAPYPLTIEVLKRWNDQLDGRGVKLVPVTDLYNEVSAR
tara:strand:- start:3007 stop:4035 length:1029 start_codon:yes stop_codon:yes gene_type:complete